MRDYFNKDADGLLTKKLYLFDMDGTIYREDYLFEGVIQLLEQIERKGARYAFITNNPSKSVLDYIDKLNRLGINGVSNDKFFTSAQASIMVLREKFGTGLIYAQGTRSFIRELRDSGLNATERYDSEIVAVLVSFDPELTGDKLRTTCEVLTRLDVPYYATNPDWVCPVDFGAVPDCGSMCIGIRYATGKSPIFIGKPEPTMIYELMKKFGASREETVVVGDRLYTDIMSGINAGVDTICVLSGEATIADIMDTPIVDRPTYVFNSVKDMVI